MSRGATARSADTPLPRVIQIGKFYTPHRGGIESHLSALCEALKERVRLKVLVANTRWRTVVEVVNRVEVTRIATSVTVAGAPVCPGMATWLRRTPADIVHMHLPNPGAVLAYLVSGHPGRLVVSYHSDTVRQKVLGKWFEPFLIRALNRCAAIAVATSTHLDTSPLLRRYADRCHVIPYGFALEEWNKYDPGVVSAIRRRYGDRVVLTVGRLVYYKGFEYLLRAMRDVQAQLLIIGDGPLRSELERLARRERVAERITFLGEVEDVIPYYHTAQLLVLPSIARSEAFGIVQVEAMACGKPVINTRLSSGAASVSPHGLTGLTVPPGDPEALAAAINQLLGDPELRSRLGAAGRKRAWEEFTQDRMAERILGLYTAVLQGESRRAPAAGLSPVSVSSRS